MHTGTVIAAQNEHVWVVWTDCEFYGLTELYSMNERTFLQKNWELYRLLWTVQKDRTVQITVSCTEILRAVQITVSCTEILRAVQIELYRKTESDSCTDYCELCGWDLYRMTVGCVEWLNGLMWKLYRITELALNECNCRLYKMTVLYTMTVTVR